MRLTLLQYKNNDEKHWQPGWFMQLPPYEKAGHKRKFVIMLQMKGSYNTSTKYHGGKPIYLFILLSETMHFHICTFIKWICSYVILILYLYWHAQNRFPRLSLSRFNCSITFSPTKGIRDIMIMNYIGPIEKLFCSISRK